jgi:hypothetical protein
VSKHKSRLLFNKPPLTLDPDLAVMIGGWEAVVLQQIHYWLEINREAERNFRDGHYWTFNTYANWQKQFPWLSVKRIKCVITNLEKMNLLISDNFNSLKIDRTKWYRINYESLYSLEIVSGNGRPKRDSSMAQKGPMGDFIDSEAKIDPEQVETMRAAFIVNDTFGRKEKHDG